jgi:hypothetical protein
MFVVQNFTPEVRKWRDGLVEDNTRGEIYGEAARKDAKYEDLEDRSPGLVHSTVARICRYSKGVSGREARLATDPAEG